MPRGNTGMSEWRPRVLGVVAAAALLALAAGSFKPFYFQMLTRDRDRARAALGRVAFGKMPGYEKFLVGVRSRTEPGDTIALVVPMTEWSGYSWAYYRASYVLAGRTVLPLMDASNRVHPENLSAAVYVAAWESHPRDASARVVWAEDGGALLRRQR